MRRFQLDQSDISTLKNLTIDCELGRYGVEVHKVWVPTPALAADFKDIFSLLDHKELLALTSDAQEWYDDNKHKYPESVLENAGMDWHKDKEGA